MATLPKDALARELYKLHHRHGYACTDYFRWMVDDVLVGFGVPLRDTPPGEAVPHIYELAALYADQVHQAAPFDDVLGGTYMALVSSWGQKSLGQYFTPAALARMLAALTLGDTLPDQPLVTVCDPACGSGAMLLAAAAHVLELHGPAALKRLSLTGIDLDSFCARLFPCQVLGNLFAHELKLGELLVYHGNSLGPLDDLNVVVHASHRDLDRRELLSAKHPARAPMIQAAAESAGMQLGLFDETETAQSGGRRHGL